MVGRFGHSLSSATPQTAWPLRAASPLQRHPLPARPPPADLQHRTPRDAGAARAARAAAAVPLLGPAADWRAGRRHGGAYPAGAGEHRRAVPTGQPRLPTVCWPACYCTQPHDLPQGGKTGHLCPCDAPQMTFATCYDTAARTRLSLTAFAGTRPSPSQPCAPLPEPLVIDIGPAWARLASPDLPELCGLIGRQLPPWQLLQRLADAGLHLLPDTGACGGGGLVGGGAEEAARADRGGKDEEMERAMCNDVSRIWWVALSCAVLCCAVLCCAVLCCAVLCLARRTQVWQGVPTVPPFPITAGRPAHVSALRLGWRCLLWEPSARRRRSQGSYPVHLRSVCLALPTAKTHARRTPFPSASVLFSLPTPPRRLAAGHSWWPPAAGTGPWGAPAAAAGSARSQTGRRAAAPARATRQGFFQRSGTRGSGACC
jgi:hypothetical protein